VRPHGGKAGACVAGLISINAPNREVVANRAGMERQIALEASPAGRRDVPATAGLPAVVPPPPPAPRRSSRWRLLLALLGVAVVAIAAAYWYTHQAPSLPAGIAWSNGRLEADQIDIDTKAPGRVVAVLVDEGAMEHAGQVVARMDTRDLEASLRQAEAQIAQADHTLAGTRAELEQAASQVVLTAQELQRARTLQGRGFETQEVVDQRQSQFNAARAVYTAAQTKINASVAAPEAAVHSAEVIRVNIGDSTLVAPKDGPIQYRLANQGEVLGAGGRVFSMLDMVTSTWTCSCPRRRRDGWRSAPMRASCWMRAEGADTGEGDVRLQPEPVHPEDGGDQVRA
jgi:HlyD family secretion protein